MSLWKILNMGKLPANILKLTPLPCPGIDPAPSHFPVLSGLSSMDRTHTWSSLLLQVAPFIMSIRALLVRYTHRHTHPHQANMGATGITFYKGMNMNSNQTLLCLRLPIKNACFKRKFVYSVFRMLTIRLHACMLICSVVPSSLQPPGL